MTFSEWSKEVKGQGIDYDGAYGVQCVDLAKHYIKYVLETTPQSIGDAKYYWYNRESTYLKNIVYGVSKNENFKPQMGDIFVRLSGEWGHIGICDGRTSGKQFYAYEQNYNGKNDACALNLIGDYTSSKYQFLRPINIKNLDGIDSDTSKKIVSLEEVEIEVWTGSGTIKNEGKIYRFANTDISYYWACSGRQFDFIGRKGNYYYGEVHGLCNSHIKGFIPANNLNMGTGKKGIGTKTLKILKETLGRS